MVGSQGLSRKRLNDSPAGLRGSLSLWERVGVRAAGLFASRDSKSDLRPLLLAVGLLAGAGSSQAALLWSDLGATQVHETGATLDGPDSYRGGY